MECNAFEWCDVSVLKSINHCVKEDKENIVPLFEKSIKIDSSLARPFAASTATKKKTCDVNTQNVYALSLNLQNKTSDLLLSCKKRNNNLSVLAARSQKKNQLNGILLSLKKFASLSMLFA